MDRYEAWMKEWNTYKFNWVDSRDVVDAFVLRVIPPKKKYSTMLHFELALEITRYTGLGARIIQKRRCIEISDGSPANQTPSIYFHDKDASSRYPWTVDYGVTVGAMTATTDPVGVDDEFGFVSLRMENFRRVYVLKMVMVLKKMGFGVLHGEVESAGYRTWDSSDRYHSKLPSCDDPIWMYV